MIIDGLSGAVPIPDGYGAARAALVKMRGYLEHFGGQPNPAGDIEDESERLARAHEAGKAACPSTETFLTMLDEADARLAVVHNENYRTALGIKSPSNDELATFVKDQGGCFLGLAGVDPWSERAPAEIKRARRDLGLNGVVISPFKQHLLPTDQRMGRVFAACESAGAPVFLHTGINWWYEAPYDMGHPKYLDQVASAFPRLKIVALHGSWPWVMDMMMVAWRHPNVYVDISAQRPKHFAGGDGSWAPLLQYGGRMLADRIVFGSSWNLMGRSIKELADEVRALPLKDDVVEKWLYGNAVRLFDL